MPRGQMPSVRFIPACTGNTDYLRDTVALSAVHPRVYGEYEAPLDPYLYPYGSSPRVRGIPDTFKV